MRLHGDRLPYRNPEPLYRDGVEQFGSGADNEVWSFGEDNYQILKKYLLLRESLKPYIKTLMQHRRKQQQTHARHADMQRQRQTHRAERRNQRDDPDRDHVASSNSDESRSHSSIRPVSVSSQVCFSSIRRASS